MAGALSHRAFLLAFLSLCLGSTANSILAQTPFTEEASSRGIDYVTFGPANFGAGVALVDLDEDGDPDVVLVGKADGEVGVYENDGTGGFVSRTSLSGIPMLPDASGIAAADYDGDGDLDLYITVIGGSDRLLRNEGSFVFADVTVQAGLGDPGAGHGCAWGDYDGDGWLDLYVSNRTESSIPEDNRLYRNQGNGTFQDVAVSLGVDLPGDPTFHATFIDFDRNGSTDLYICNDKGNPDCSFFRNHMFQNVAGSFVDVTDESRTEACVACMGVGVGDLDRNGWLDLYCTNIPDGNVLFMNQGDGTFNEEAANSGTESNALGWGNIFLDHDNDGFLDLYVCNSNAPNRLYDCGASWPCADVGPAMGVATTGPSYCVSSADIENDGDLDLLVQTDTEPIRLYINHQDGTNHWLKLRLIGTPPNTHAVGAVVTLRSSVGTQQREVRSTIGYKSSWPATLHFGLGDDTQADEVVIHWPDGSSTVMSGVAADQTLEVDQGADRPGESQGLVLERLGGGQIGLDWSPSCAAGDTDYIVYEGVLGDFTSHVPLTCGTGGMPAWDTSMTEGSHYYLVVPRRTSSEGFLGASSGGSPRPRGLGHCVEQLADSCP